VRVAVALYAPIMLGAHTASEQRQFLIGSTNVTTCGAAGSAINVTTLPGRGSTSNVTITPGCIGVAGVPLMAR
jgi:hypothetical protein